MAKRTKEKEKEKQAPTVEQNPDNTDFREEFAFGKVNYYILLIGLAITILGFILMIGGGSKDPDVFNYDMFGFRRMTLAPILVLLGFAAQFFAIFKKS